MIDSIGGKGRQIDKNRIGLQKIERTLSNEILNFKEGEIDQQHTRKVITD